MLVKGALAKGRTVFGENGQNVIQFDATGIL
jgi:hypothetical protein